MLAEGPYNKDLFNQYFYKHRGEKKKTGNKPTSDMKPLFSLLKL